MHLSLLYKRFHNPIAKQIILSIRKKIFSYFVVVIRYFLNLYFLFHKFTINA